MSYNNFIVKSMGKIVTKMKKVRKILKDCLVHNNDILLNLAYEKYNIGFQ